MNYTNKQMMAIALSRELEDDKTYIVGTGLPLIGASLAKHTHAKNASLLFETGIMDGNPIEVPTSVGDLRICHAASALWPQFRYCGFEVVASKAGKIAGGFLGGAQIDPYGNLNSTSLGDYNNPDVRFSGSGGANGIATFCDTFIIMKHEKRRFVEKVDYITSPGWIGPEGRESVGLDPTKGPRAVITELGIMRFDDDTKRIYLSEYFEGTTPEEIRDNTGFFLDISRAKKAKPPMEEELSTLVNKVDPTGLMTK